MPLVTLRFLQFDKDPGLDGLKAGSEWKAEIYMGAEIARALKAAVDAGMGPTFEVASVGYVPDEKPPAGR